MRSRKRLSWAGSPSVPVTRSDRIGTSVLWVVGACRTSSSGATLRVFVALKILKANRFRTGLARFRREFRALARLKHPNVIRVESYGDIHGHLISPWSVSRAQTCIRKSVDSAHGSVEALGSGRGSPDRPVSCARVHPPAGTDPPRSQAQQRVDQ